MSRALLLALILLTTPLPALGQCDYRSTYSGAHRLTALDLAVDGNSLWVATSYGVAIYDRSVDQPLPVTSRALPGPTSEIEVVGSLAYAASGSTLFTLRRTGTEIAIVNSLELGAVANDLIAVGQYLYVAASSGFLQIDLLIPDRPVVSSRLSTSSSGPAFSVAHLDGLIYLADGDRSLEAYTVRIPALPQKLGTLDLARPSSWVRVANNYLLVSDGFQTEIRVGDGLALGTGAFGSVAAAPHSAQVIYAASGDRRIRAVDLSSPSTPLLLFEHQLPASSGTVNRVSDLAAVDGRLYVAAGDLGLVTFDARQFIAPFSLRAHALGATRSTFTTGSRMFTSPEAGALKEYSLSESGALTFLRQWDEGRSSTIQDGSTTRLLATSGATATIWDISVTPPAALVAANLRAAIRGAVLSGETAIVLLSDFSLWRVAAGQTSQIAIGDARPSHIARGGTGVALADLNESGTTTLRWFANGDPSTTPVVASIEGAATSGIAANAAGFVAAVTFRGLLGVDFSSAAPQTIQFPRQGGTPARDLFASGNDLFVLTSNALEVWSISARQLTKTVAIPSDSSHVHASELATVSTADGVAVINYRTASSQPQLLPIVETNDYYISATGSTGFGHLVRDGAVRTLRVDPAGRLLSEHTTSIPAAARDVAAIGDDIYSVSDAGRVSGPGVEFQMNEGADASALSLHAVKNALYLSIVRGCLSTGCEKRTLVLSTAGGALTQTASLPGALLDADVSGNRAWALFDDPDEIRVLDVTNASQPSTVVARASEGNPVSIAFAAGAAAVYTIGQKIYAYGESDLGKLGELLDPYSPDPTGRVSYLDQELSIDGSCVVVAGREFAPRVYRIQSATQWQSAPAPSVPAAVRRIVTINGAHYLLTDYSLEIWSSATPLRRTRPVR